MDPGRILGHAARGAQRLEDARHPGDLPEDVEVASLDGRERRHVEAELDLDG